MEPSIHSQRTRALCLLLRALRVDKGLTQQQLAKKLGKPQSFVTKYERGERQLDVAEWLSILEALGADPVSFLRVLLVAGMPKRPVRVK